MRQVGHSFPFSSLASSVISFRAQLKSEVGISKAHLTLTLPPQYESGCFRHVLVVQRGVCGTRGQQAGVMGKVPTSGAIQLWHQETTDGDDNTVP